MSDNKHMPVLNDTLERVAKFATKLNEHGIYIQLLNHHSYENRGAYRLKTEEEVRDRINKIRCEGNTRLGSVLYEKVVMPMIISKVEKHLFKKPMIVVIITDGEVSWLPL
jgi:hypothetical protein